MMKGLLALGGIGFLAVPAIAIVTAVGVGAGAAACIAAAASGVLAESAPVPAEARTWIAETKAACPQLPDAWIAAVMAQESGFNPNAWANDANGGTWGLFQLNASIWQATYGHPWSADLDGNGTWDVRDPVVHARVGGQYLCTRLAGVQAIRVAHPDWPSSSIPLLDALIIAHNAGESRLRTYPDIPQVTATFITDVDARAAAWSGPATPGTAAPGKAGAAAPAGSGCLPRLGVGRDVVVPPGAPLDVAAAVHTAMTYVGVTSGWTQLCDRLACRAYGYWSSGYVSAAAHWQDVAGQGRAHPGDTCPPLGAFAFWQTGRPDGHVSVVVQADPGCDPSKILLTANEVFDAATGHHGGVYLISFAQLNAGYVHGAGYLGWSDPVCRGAVLPAGTVHPVPAGM